MAESTFFLHVHMNIPSEAGLLHCSPCAIFVDFRNGLFSVKTKGRHRKHMQLRSRTAKQSAALVVCFNTWAFLSYLKVLYVFARHFNLGMLYLT